MADQAQQTPKYLTAADILKRGESLPTKDITLPGGSVVRVKTLAVAQRDEYLVVLRGEKKIACGPTAYLVLLTALDGDGKPLFSMKDAARLGQLNNEVIDPIYKAALKLNGLAAESVDDAEGN